MKLPSGHEEKANSIDYTGSNYVSPNPDFPDQGFLGVEAVKMLAPFVKNFVLEVPNSLMVPSPMPIAIPPLQTFTFIQVTGKVVARTVHGSTIEGEGAASGAKAPACAKAQAASSSKAGPVAQGGPGSSAGKKPPTTPKAKGKIEPQGEDGGDDDDDEGNEGEEDDDEDDAADDAGMSNELAQLEALEGKKETPKKNGGKRKGAGSTPTSGNKKPKKK